MAPRAPTKKASSYASTDMVVIRKKDLDLMLVVLGSSGTPRGRWPGVNWKWVTENLLHKDWTPKAQGAVEKRWYDLRKSMKDRGFEIPVHSGGGVEKERLKDSEAPTAYTTTAKTDNELHENAGQRSQSPGDDGQSGLVGLGLDSLEEERADAASDGYPETLESSLSDISESIQSFAVDNDTEDETEDEQEAVVTGPRRKRARYD